MQADIGDLAACERTVQGLDCVVHLGAVAVEGRWEKILPAKIVGCHKVFKGARARSIERWRQVQGAMR